MPAAQGHGVPCTSCAGVTDMGPSDGLKATSPMRRWSRPFLTEPAGGTTPENGSGPTPDDLPPLVTRRESQAMRDQPHAINCFTGLESAHRHEEIGTDSR